MQTPQHPLLDSVYKFNSNRWKPFFSEGSGKESPSARTKLEWCCSGPAASRWASENPWTDLETAVHGPSHLKETRQLCLSECADIPVARCGQEPVCVYCNTNHKVSCLSDSEGQERLMRIRFQSAGPVGLWLFLMVQPREREGKRQAKKRLQEKHLFPAVGLLFHVPQPELHLISTWSQRASSGDDRAAI